MSLTPSAEQSLVSEYQTTLLYSVEKFFGRSPIPRKIRQAFLDTPRHLFAQKFYSSTNRKWITLDDENLREHLPELYSDHPLCIFRNESGRSLSTVSQPSLVLYMLDLLELKQGHRVFELGGGSGWNAALMARLVGERGQVVSVEIIDSLASTARDLLNGLNLKQAEIHPGDANQYRSSEDENFDRGIFTASAWDLPALMFDRIAPKGLLLFVVKAQPSYDLLCLLEKRDEAFDCQLLMTCSFVPVTGERTPPELTSHPVESAVALDFQSDLNWSDIKIKNTSINAFLDFAKIVFDCQETYLIKGEAVDFDEEFWGIYADDETSLLLFNEDRLQLYGTENALVGFRRAAKRWQKANEPEVDELKLSIHESGKAPEPTNDQWLVHRGESTLVWGFE